MTRYFLTGGAGFIGSRLANRLAATPGSDVTVYDNLHPQVHGAAQHPAGLAENIRFIRGDVGDREALTRALTDAAPDAVTHLAAETGTGQSADEPSRYCHTNVTGTANLIEAMRAANTVSRVVLPSSRAVYGEGPYRAADGTVIIPPARSDGDMRRGRFAPLPEQALTPLPVRSDTPVAPCSIYASTKLMQEYLLTQGALGAWHTAVLRLQNVYGPGQSLKNPYTGVLSIFSQQILEGKTLNIFEDGAIVRDFVFVDDVVDALYRALFADGLPDGLPVNIGSGTPATILDAARILLTQLGAPETRTRVSGDYRPGDIRHACADIGEAARFLGWQPQVSLEDGLSRLARWVQESRNAGAPVSRHAV